MEQISTLQVQPEANEPDTVFPASKDLRLLIFSFLPGCDLFHKIAVLNKNIRKSLPYSDLLDQDKIITIKASSDNYPNFLPIDSFLYGVNLASTIRI